MICMLEDSSKRNSIFLSPLPNSYNLRMMSPRDCSWVLLSFEEFFIVIHISQSCIHLSFLTVSEHSWGGVLFICVFPLTVGGQYTVFELPITGITFHSNPAPLNISAFEIGSYIQGAVWAECLQCIWVSLASLGLFLQWLRIVSWPFLFWGSGLRAALPQSNPAWHLEDLLLSGFFWHL